MKEFSLHFWGEKNNGFDALHQNMKGNIVVSKELYHFFQERCAFEDNCAKFFTKLSKQASPPSLSNYYSSFNPIWNILKQSTEKISTIHTLLLHSLQEVIKDLHKYIEEQNKRQKQVKEEESSTIESIHSFNTAQVNVNKTREIYKQKYQEYEKLRSESPNVPTKDLEKGEAKYEKAREDHKQSIEKYTEARKSYEKYMSTSCQKFQEYEIYQVTKMKSFVGGYSEILTNTTTSLHKVVDEFKQDVEGVDVEKLIDAFVENRQTGTEKPANIEFEDISLAASKSPRTEVASFVRQASSSSNLAGKGVTVPEPREAFCGLPNHLGPPDFNSPPTDLINAQTHLRPTPTTCDKEKKSAGKKRVGLISFARRKRSSNREPAGNHVVEYVSRDSTPGGGLACHVSTDELSYIDAGGADADEFSPDLPPVFNETSTSTSSHTTTANNSVSVSASTTTTTSRVWFRKHNLRSSKTWFLKAMKKRDKNKKKKEDQTSTVTAADKNKPGGTTTSTTSTTKNSFFERSEPVSHKDKTTIGLGGQPSILVDEEGYSIKPPEINAKTKESSSSNTESESESDNEDRTNRLKVEIKPLRTLSPSQVSLDELKKSVDRLVISPQLTGQGYRTARDSRDRRRRPLPRCKSEDLDIADCENQNMAHDDDKRKITGPSTHAYAFTKQLFQPPTIGQARRSADQASYGDRGDNGIGGGETLRAAPAPPLDTSVKGRAMWDNLVAEGRRQPAKTPPYNSHVINDLAIGNASACSKKISNTSAITTYYSARSSRNPTPPEFVSSAQNTSYKTSCPSKSNPSYAFQKNFESYHVNSGVGRNSGVRNGADEDGSQNSSLATGISYSPPNTTPLPVNGDVPSPQKSYIRGTPVQSGNFSFDRVIVSGPDPKQTILMNRTSPPPLGHQYAPSSPNSYYASNATRESSAFTSRNHSPVSFTSSSSTWNDEEEMERPLQAGQPVPVCVWVHEKIGAVMSSTDPSANKSQAKIFGILKLLVPYKVKDFIVQGNHLPSLWVDIKHFENVRVGNVNGQIILNPQVKGFENAFPKSFFSFDMPALERQIVTYSDDVTEANRGGKQWSKGKRFIVLDLMKYQVEKISPLYLTPSSPTGQSSLSCLLPLLLTCSWKHNASARTVELRINYSLNGEALRSLRKINSLDVSSPSPGSGTTGRSRARERSQLCLSDVEIGAYLSAPFDAGRIQAKPHSQWDPDTKKLYWNLSDMPLFSDDPSTDDSISPHHPSYEGSSTLGSLRAKYEYRSSSVAGVDDGYQPTDGAYNFESQTVYAKFRCRGLNLTPVSFSLPTETFTLAAVKNGFSSGKYTCLSK